MELFRLPYTTVVNKVIPKNSFDAFTSSRVKKLFSERIQRITWLHKLSPETVNLEARAIQEIQVFGVELKLDEDITELLNVIDRAIPYHIVFQVLYDGRVYVSTSVKHAHPSKEDRTVVDWRFRSDWIELGGDFPYQFRLKRSIDVVHRDLCKQLSGLESENQDSVEDVIERQRKITMLTKEVDRLQAAIARSNQFNKKVELNLRLKEIEKELAGLSQRMIIVT